VVEIRDENNRPVAGAIVIFTAPDRGASGTFSGSNMLTVTTDQQGIAVGRGFQPNAVEGNLELRVQASSQGRTASTVIRMQNISGIGAAAGGSGKLIGILVAVGGAAAAGAVLATRRGGSAAPPPATQPPATTITAGPGTVGQRP
jgi:hypothetical protein